MKINLVCIGKIKEQYFVDAIKEYQKRLQKYCDFKIIELEEITQTEIEKTLSVEGDNILKRLRGEVFIFDIGGEMLTSEALSEYVANVKNLGCGEITFVIGSSHGLHDMVKSKGKRISFGRVTYPHQLMRVIAVEQIYRSFCIMCGSPYHK